MLFVRSQTVETKKQDITGSWREVILRQKKHTHTHKNKPEVLHISETMEPENWGRELDWPVWYGAEQFTERLHI